MSIRDVKEEDRDKAALDYYEFPTPGKVSITPTKQLSNQNDLALAYTPGVAAACRAIVDDPLNVFRFTARGNLVGVITNGTAVLDRVSQRILAGLGERARTKTGPGSAAGCSSCQVVLFRASTWKSPRWVEPSLRPQQMKRRCDSIPNSALR